MNSINQTQTKKLIRKRLFIIGAVVIIVAAGILTAMYALNKNRTNTTADTSESSKSPSTKSVTSNTSSTANTSAISGSGNTANDTKSNATGSTTTTATSSVYITSVDQSIANTISVSAYTNTLVSSGTCTFTFTKDSSVITRSTETSPSASTSSCGTLTINNSAFPSLGAWKLAVTFTSGSITGQSDTQTVVLK